MADPEKLVLMATIRTAHGLKGELNVTSYASNPVELNRYGILYSDDGREFKILKIYKKTKRVIVLFDGISNRNDAEKLRNLNLYVKRQSFKDEELKEDEFFHADLEGMKIFDATGKYWGAICGIYDFGAGTVIELCGDTLKKKFMLPFTKTAVLDIDMNENKMLIDPIAAGLYDMNMKKNNIESQSDSVESVS
ncbi:MAG: 16S rRNA processing protein RimM [Candidatus Liberibacter europaeus]|nr:16S rRNA processing protein RimM [Candidatus Liberibacter europaeus]